MRTATINNVAVFIYGAYMTLPPIETESITSTTKVLNMLRDGIIAHDARLQNIRDDLNETTKDVEMLKSIVITGNPPELSHSERIRQLENYINSVKDTIKYWGRLIGGALLLNFLGFMTGILVAIIKFLPVLEKLASKP